MLGGGFRRQDIAILAGDVGSGKSALALGIAIRAARAGVPTLHLSGEMSPTRVMERALALEGKASVDDLRQGRLDPAVRAAVGGAAHRLRDIPLLLRPLLGEGFDEVREALDIVPPRALLVVDSLQLAPSPRPAASSPRRSFPATARTGRIPGRRWMTWAVWVRSSRTRTWCSRSIGRRCTGRARAWRARPS